jgi:hypothetical protein
MADTVYLMLKILILSFEIIVLSFGAIVLSFELIVLKSLALVTAGSMPENWLLPSVTVC